MRLSAMLCALAVGMWASPVLAAETVLTPVQVPEWKAVYGRIEARDRIPARARLGGTLVSLSVAAGDVVTAGQVLAQVVDSKIAFQLAAIDAQVQALTAQLDNARAEVVRGEDLLARGVTTAQRLDALRTQADVLAGQIAANRANRQVVEQQAAEGTVLAPMAGRVLQVPVAAGAVVQPGETVAEIAGGGFFLRLAVPERHAAALRTGDAIEIETAGGAVQGVLARVYPLIENGRVVADVEVAGLPEDFVDARLLVRLPVGVREALMVPLDAVRTAAGLDFVTVAIPGGAAPGGAGTMDRVVVLGQRQVIGGVDLVEVMTGLVAGDLVVTP